MRSDFYGYHSEWNLGSPGGWDYQRINQEIGKAVWQKLKQKTGISIELDFDHPHLLPLEGFVTMLKNAHHKREGSNPGLIAVVAEEETLEDVVENRNLVVRLNRENGLSSALMAPHELELKDGKIVYHGQSISVIFVDFNTDTLLKLHKKHTLNPLLQAVREDRVINPRGTEPINSKSMFEVLTDPRFCHRFHPGIVRRTPWTRQFYERSTLGPKGENIADLPAWTRANWETLVLKPERGYSGKGVRVGGIHDNVEASIDLALRQGDTILQEKIPLNLWAEWLPELDPANRSITEKQIQTDFRCLFGKSGLFGFLGRYGGVPTNVGSGGGVQPLATLRSDLDIGEATQNINDVLLSMDYDNLFEISEFQNQLALDHQFTYLLGPIKIAPRPRLITEDQIKTLETYCGQIWSACLILEKMWLADELDLRMNLDPEELEIIRSQPWGGQPAIFASDGLFSFGAHIK